MKNFIDTLSTHFLICQEMIEGKGEDSGFEEFNELGGISCVCDGCGGLGALSYPMAENKTGAYLASRITGGAVKTWFDDSIERDSVFDVQSLKQMIFTWLKSCEARSGSTGIKMKGSMIRPFPTTLACTVAYKQRNRIVTKHIWAGDSRTFFLTPKGLQQISEDDIDGEDALSNISNDGVLTNIVTADGKFELHEKEIAINEPCILFAATDGCFGYLSSPMMFEYLILDALYKADNIESWKKNICSFIGEFSEDDYTFSLMAFGYDSFRSMKQAYVDRHDYIGNIAVTFESATDQEKQRLWENYRGVYYGLHE